MGGRDVGFVRGKRGEGVTRAIFIFHRVVVGGGGVVAPLEQNDVLLHEAEGLHVPFLGLQLPEDRAEEVANIVQHTHQRQQQPLGVQRVEEHQQCFALVAPRLGIVRVEANVSCQIESTNQPSHGGGLIQDLRNIRLFRLGWGGLLVASVSLGVSFITHVLLPSLLPLLPFFPRGPCGLGCVLASHWG